MNPKSSEPDADSRPYPMREGESDCLYYMRTGTCRFGDTCRFNHPPNREQLQAIANATMKGEYPERIGQPECQYYLRTGTCKFGAMCKFHHPRDKARIIAFNTMGYPFRSKEMDCAYYMKYGLCKFGSTCKFNHPQLLNTMVSLHDSTTYHHNHSPATGQLSHPLSTRASFIPSPQWQSPSSYAPLVVPQGIISVPRWNTISGQVASVLSSENQQITIGNSRNDFSSQYKFGSAPMGYYAFQRDVLFPQRPGQPLCQFYMKTGGCKFGALCKFHHPRERQAPPPDCDLSQVGLPLRPGEPVCVFYSRYGLCKYGPSCKFDHPMSVLAHNTSTSSTSDSQADHRILAPSSTTVELSFAPDEIVKTGSTGSNGLSLSESRQIPTGDNTIEE